MFSFPKEPTPIVPLTQRKLKIITTHGWAFDQDNLPANFSMPTYISSVRAAGYILNENLYVPVDRIAAIFAYTEETTMKDNLVHFRAPPLQPNDKPPEAS